jgi:hypothetical protein
LLKGARQKHTRVVVSQFDSSITSYPGICLIDCFTKKWWLKVGLLRLLQEAYGFFSFGYLLSNPQIESTTFFEKWRMWRLTKFDPENIRKTSGLSIDEIKEFYVTLCHLGYGIDPLSHWFVLLQIIDDAKKKGLQISVISVVIVTRFIG